MNDNTRKMRIGLGTFDLIKGFAIILMIFGHMMPHYKMGSLVPLIAGLLTAFQIFSICTNPMFFVAGGFGFKEKTPAKMLKDTFSQLLKPYLYITLAVAVVFPISYCVQNGVKPDVIPTTLKWVLALLFGLHDPVAEQKVILGIEVRACWVAWFLLAMFVAFNVLNLVLKIKNPKAQIAVVVLCVIAGYYLGIFNVTYFCIPQGLIATGYCYIGYMFKKRKFFERKQFPVWLCIILLIITIVEFYLGEFDLAYAIFKNGLLDIVAVGCAGVFLFVLGAYAGQCEWKGLDALKQIGIYTYWIICIHSVELICFPWERIVKSMPEYQWLALIIEIGLKLIIIWSGCSVLMKIMRYRHRKIMQKSRLR